MAVKYEWKVTRNGRRYVRTVVPDAKPAPTPVEDTSTPEPASQPEPLAGPEGFEYMTKSELVAYADENGIDSTGTKAEVLARVLTDG